MSADPQIARLELDLNDFDVEVRARALRELLSLAHRGEVRLEPEKGVANMHAHTFFGYNAYGYSPSALAWQAMRRGFRLMAKVDFDTLDGADEFLSACDLVGVRGAVGIETRVFVRELADRVVNSPGEPEISYHMGVGFATGRVPQPAAAVLANLRERAVQRNRAIVERINAYLEPVAVDYARDVLTLTPSGNATERHVVAAYVAAGQSVPDPVGFWARKLGLRRDRARILAADPARFRSLVRSRLMKQGGVGYIRPGPNTFATLEEFHRMIVTCGGLPCACWLDGASEAEQATEELLQLWVGKGVVVQNVIPEYARKEPSDLRRLVRLASELALPLNVGTEMNSPGQKLIDEFDAPDLAPYRQRFLDGAHFVYGHTALQRALGLGYHSDWARSYMASRKDRNAFYTKVGRRVPPGRAALAQLQALDPTVSPAKMLARIGRLF